jgi:hypothetical protein
VHLDKLDARKHGLRTPHANAPVLRSILVFDPVLAWSNGFSDSFLDVHAATPHPAA